MENVTNTYYLIASCFIGYFIISYVFKTIGISNVERALLTNKGLLLINLKHTLGIILFGVITFLILPQYRFLIARFEIPELKILISFLIIVLVSALLAFNSAQKKLKKEVKISQYNFSQGWRYINVRIVFLVAYEFFFRGVIFFTILEFNGLITAIVITTLLYVLIHIFDSKQEILGAIPFGIVLCLFSYYTNSIWIAFIIHITLSAVYEFSMFKHLTLKTKVS